MLHLMKLYADSLALGENRDKLDATIEPLEQTSIPVDNFRDHRPIHETGDVRLEQNQKVLKWFKDWEASNS